MSTPLEYYLSRYSQGGGRSSWRGRVMSVSPSDGLSRNLWKGRWLTFLTQRLRKHLLPWALWNVWQSLHLRAQRPRKVTDRAWRRPLKFFGTSEKIFWFPIRRSLRLWPRGLRASALRVLEVINRLTPSLPHSISNLIAVVVIVGSN